MFEILSHLLPDFSALFSGEIGGISVIFWMLMIVIFGIAVWKLREHYQHFLLRYDAIKSLIDNQSKEHLASNRREILQTATDKNVLGTGYLWREFDESLVVSSDQKSLFNTLDAEHFFNAKNLAPGLTASRLLAATPSFLVAIGVLGTFIGLTVGLEGLAGKTAEVDDLKTGINSLIGGASVAFMTSVWGVFLSLVLNFWEKLLERKVLGNIQDLQHQIDFLYPRIPAEQSLVHIAENTKESSASLQELHERIGDRLQETINGMSDAMQQAFTDALNNIMAPAINTLVNTTSQQSTQVLDSLVQSFMDGMTTAGKEQGQLMASAAEEVKHAVSGMSSQFTSLIDTMNLQQQAQADSADKARVMFDAQVEKLSTAADQRQGQLEARFNDLMTGLSGQLEQQLTSAKELDAKRQEQASAQLHEMMKRFNEELSTSSKMADERELNRHTAMTNQVNNVMEGQQSILESIAEAMRSNQAQSHQIAEQHQKLLVQLENATDGIKQSSQHMDNSANQLGLLATNVRLASEVLGQRLESISSQIQQIGSENSALAVQVRAQAESLKELQASLLEGANQLKHSSEVAQRSFGEMRQYQAEFLSGVKAEFSGLGDVLKQQVQVIEKQAEEWLQTYAHQVSQQVHDRMDQWNKETVGFATNMLAAVQAISNVVDELESR